MTLISGHYEILSRKQVISALFPYSASVVKFGVNLAVGILKTYLRFSSFNWDLLSEVLLHHAFAVTPRWSQKAPTSSVDGSP